MGAYSLKFNSAFNKTIIISFTGHILFFYCVYFTFSPRRETRQTTTVSFFGSILGARDLSLRKINKTKKVALPLKAVHRKLEARSVASFLSFSYAKPLHPSNEISPYAKHLNKFLVNEKKPEAQDMVKQKYFEPPGWENIELRLKPE